MGGHLRCPHCFPPPCARRETAPKRKRASASAARAKRRRQTFGSKLKRAIPGVAQLTHFYFGDEAFHILLATQEAVRSYMRSQLRQRRVRALDAARRDAHAAPESGGRVRKRRRPLGKMRCAQEGCDESPLTGHVFGARGFPFCLAVSISKCYKHFAPRPAALGELP